MRATAYSEYLVWVKCTALGQDLRDMESLNKDYYRKSFQRLFLQWQPDTNATVHTLLNSSVYCAITKKGTQVTSFIQSNWSCTLARTPQMLARNRLVDSSKVLDMVCVTVHVLNGHLKVFLNTQTGSCRSR